MSRPRPTPVPPRGAPRPRPARGVRPWRAIPRRAAALAALLVLLGAPAARAQAPVEVVEATIADLHREMLARRLTARTLVQAYLARIEAYDDRGPSLNAIRVVNEAALATADSLDRALAATGQLSGPLHGIPVIVKDNYDVVGFATTAGSASLAEARPGRSCWPRARWPSSRSPPTRRSARPGTATPSTPTR